MRGVSALAALVTVLVGAEGVPGFAQAGSGDPLTWRPLTSIDLRLVGPAQAPFAAIWSDRIGKAHAKAREQGLFTPVGHIRAASLNLVIRSPEVTVVLSILYDGSTCEKIAGATEVWRCPLRLARFENGRTSILEGKGCFAGGRPGGALPVAYGSYDLKARAIRLGVATEGKLVEGCSQSVPVKKESE